MPTPHKDNKNNSHKKKQLKRQYSPRNHGQFFQAHSKFNGKRSKGIFEKGLICNEGLLLGKSWYSGRTGQTIHKWIEELVITSSSSPSPLLTLPCVLCLPLLQFILAVRVRVRVSCCRRDAITQVISTFLQFTTTMWV